MGKNGAVPTATHPKLRFEGIMGGGIGIEPILTNDNPNSSSFAGEE